MALEETSIDSAWPPFLTQAYNLKAVADYETGPDSDVPPERAEAAIETAACCVEGIAQLLGDNS